VAFASTIYPSSFPTSWYPTHRPLSLFLARLTVFSRAARSRCPQSRSRRAIGSCALRRESDVFSTDFIVIAVSCRRPPPPPSLALSAATSVGSAACRPISRDHIHNDETNDRRHNRDGDRKPTWTPSLSTHDATRRLGVANVLRTLNRDNVILLNVLLSPVHTDNNVEATFDYVEATFGFVERIVRLITFDNVASSLLLVWIGL